MTLLPVSLPPLNPEFVSQMFERAKSDEAIFRNILVDQSDDPNEANFFRTGSLDDIFGQYVRARGYEARVSDFRVGPFVSDDIPGYRFPKVDPSKLAKDDVLVLIEKSNDSWIKLYRVLDNSAVKASRSEHYHQF